MLSFVCIRSYSVHCCCSFLFEEKLRGPHNLWEHKRMSNTDLCQVDIQYAGELHMSSTLLAPINDTVHNVMTHNYMDTVCSVTFGLHLNTNILTICHHWLSSDVECSSFHFLVFVSFLYGKRPVLWRKYRLPSTISAWNWTPLNFS